MRAGSSKNFASATSCFSAVALFSGERLDGDRARRAEAWKESGTAAHLKEHPHHPKPSGFTMSSCWHQRQDKQNRTRGRPEARP
jgi:hypothetical protein